MPATILVIEDNRINLDLMIYLLTAFGYKTVSAMEGLEGYEAALREQPDLILCDVQLPTIDGYEVARRLKEHPRLRAIPLVAVTALAMVGDREKMLAAGFDGYIAKPIAPETFIEEVEAFLEADKRSGRVIVASTANHDRVEPRTSGKKILVADDSSINLELAHSTLEPSGYQVIVAAQVAEAIDLARRESPDLILSDMSMPEGGGLELLRRVKSDPLLSHIPFIFLSSTYVEPEYASKALSLGASRYLVRPIEPQELLAEIEACLREASGS
ncbi:MAG TPA: response regulator [Blastocatellia bacterium]|nr:response regulator [Blastocatellia bacterium]